MCIETLNFLDAKYKRFTVPKWVPNIALNGATGGKSGSEIQQHATGQ